MRAGIISNDVREKRISQTDRATLTDAIYDAMEHGIHSISALAEQLDTSRTTIRRYKPFAEKRFQAVKLNRVAIRNLELYRANYMRERLINELDSCKTTKEKMSVYQQINNFSKHIATIGGIVTEAKINQYNNVNALVITRANPAAVQAIKDDITLA